MALSYSGRIVANPDVMIRPVGEESVILNLRSEQYLGLNSMGTEMWAALTESPTVQQAFEKILAAFDISEEVLRHDLEEFVNKLVEHQLVELRTGEISASGQHS